MARVIMYCTAVCPYCHQAERLLRQNSVNDIEKIHIDKSPADRAAMVARTGRRTVPQIFIGDRHVGGYDDLLELDRKGELSGLLAA